MKKGRSQSHTAGIGMGICMSLARVALRRACFQENEESCAQVSSWSGFLALGASS